MPAGAAVEEGASGGGALVALERSASKAETDSSLPSRFIGTQALRRSGLGWAPGGATEDERPAKPMPQSKGLEKGGREGFDGAADDVDDVAATPKATLEAPWWVELLPPPAAKGNERPLALLEREGPNPMVVIGRLFSWNEFESDEPRGRAAAAASVAPKPELLPEDWKGGREDVFGARSVDVEWEEELLLGFGGDDWEESIC